LFYTFLYRRRSGDFIALSSSANQLIPEMTRTSPIEKSGACFANRSLSFDTPGLQELYQFGNKLKLLIVATLLNGTRDIAQKDWN
jgi:hypothetical protein